MKLGKTTCFTVRVIFISPGWWNPLKLLKIKTPPVGQLELPIFLYLSVVANWSSCCHSSKYISTNHIHDHQLHNQKHSVLYEQLCCCVWHFRAAVEAAAASQIIFQNDFSSKLQQDFTSSSSVFVTIPTQTSKCSHVCFGGFRLHVWTQLSTHRCSLILNRGRGRRTGPSPAAAYYPSCSGAASVGPERTVRSERSSTTPGRQRTKGSRGEGGGTEPSASSWWRFLLGSKTRACPIRSGVSPERNPESRRHDPHTELRPPLGALQPAAPAALSPPAGTPDSRWFLPYFKFVSK